MDSLLQKFPRVSTCCFCFTIETGALIIGYLGLLGAVINFITDCSTVAILAHIKAENSTDQYYIHAAMGIYVYDLLIQAFFIVVSLFLILGVHKKNTRYIFIWLMSTLILLALKILSAILLVFYGQVGTFFGFIISILFQFYFLCVINTLYQDLESGGTVTY